MFGSFGWMELLLILVIVLIIFGAGKLPQLGEGLGKAIKGFKKTVHEPDAIDVTPAGEPPLSDQHDLFPDARPRLPNRAPSRAVLEGIGALILAWGQLEQTTADKVAVMRQSFGDVRAVGGRIRPTMQKLLAELRALVAMRDRHDKQALTVIAEIDGVLQRTAQFRQLIMEGAQEIVGDSVMCRDAKNNLIEVLAQEIARETSQIDRIRCQIAEL